MSYFLSWIPAFVMILLAILLRKIHKSWVAPGPFFALIWTLLVCLPLIFSPDMYVYPFSIWWIVISTTALGYGSLLGMSVVKKTSKTVPDIDEDSLINRFKSLKKIIVILSLIGFVNLFVLLKALGVSISIFWSFDSLASAASDFAIAKYHENYQLPTVFNYLTMFNYLGGYLGGMYWGIKKSRLAFLIFVPTLLSMFITTAKGAILYMMVLWIGGFLSIHVFKNKTSLFSFKTIVKLTGLVSVLSLLFVLLSMFRYKIYSLDMMGIIYDKLFVYYFGYLSGYSVWFDTISDHWNKLSMGIYTFAGIYNLIGVERVSGIYSTFVDINSRGGSTNIYTLLRMLIDDFGLVGSLVVLFITGFISGLSFEKVRYHKDLLFLPPLAFFYAQVLYSNVSSLLSYNSMILSWFFFLCYIISTQYKRRNKLLLQATS